MRPRPYLRAIAFFGASSLCLALGWSQTTAPRFPLSRQGGAWWLSDSKGIKFVSLGVCCVDTGSSFLTFDPENTSYAAFRFYPVKSAWASDTAHRLTGLNFNTLGAWSDLGAIDSTPNVELYRTPILNLGASAGAPWKDLWSNAIVDVMTKTAETQISREHLDLHVIGYFSDNELGWWEGALFDWIWKSDPQSGQRTQFCEILKAHYHDWPALLKDFVPQNATNWQDLKSEGRLFLRPGGAGMKSVQAYAAVLANRYYQVCSKIVKSLDPGALYLGDRYISNFYPEIAAASKPYVDVVSTNLNGDWNDGSFARFYLKSLEEITGKPILISEYYQASTDNRSGDLNNSSGFPVAATQEERASRVEVATRYLLSQPYVVGAHWFQYYDEPAKGRGDGENYDMGLVDTSNKPYDPLAKVFSSLDLAQIHSVGSPTGLDASSGIPEAPADLSDLESWNRTRGQIPPSVDSHRADLYGCYNSDGLYLAMYWNEDRFGEAFYENGKIPAMDFPLIHIRAGKSFVSISIPPKGLIQVGAEAKLIHEVRGVRNEIIVEIPKNALGVDSLKPGQNIALDVGLATRGRAYFGRWKGSFSLGEQP
jgi:hypothetical protein